MRAIGDCLDEIEEIVVDIECSEEWGIVIGGGDIGADVVLHRGQMVYFSTALMPGMSPPFQVLR